MSFIEHNNYKEFYKIYSETPERVIFFVGAGLSMPLFPSWSLFLQEMVDELDNRNKLTYDKAELTEKIKKGESFLDIADYCAETFGKADYRELIERTFDKDFEIKDVPKAYAKLLSLPQKAILTTNYDRIPEIGSQGKYSCYNNQNISEGLKALEKGKRIVIKIHGDITTQNSIVLTRKDYKEIINNNSTVQTALRSLFSTSTVCFVGFSLNDPHLDLIIDSLNTINDGHNIMHYAFLTSNSSFEMQATEKRLGIRIIPYLPSDSKHIEVYEFVNSLDSKGAESKTDSPDYSIPQILELISNNLERELNLFSYNVNYRAPKQNITIDYFTRASTEYENQREIIKLLKQSYCKSDKIKELKLNCYAKTSPTIEYVKYSPIILSLTCDYSYLSDFISNKLTENEFWRKLTFHQPFMIGNIHFTNRKVGFPLINI